MNTDRTHLSNATSFLVRTILYVNRWSVPTMERVTGVHQSLLRRYAAGTLVPSPGNLDRILSGAGIRESKEAVLAAVSELAAAFSGDFRESSTFRFKELLAEIGEFVQSAAMLGDDRTPLPVPDPADQMRFLLSCDPDDRLHVARIATEFHSFPLCLLCCEESLRQAAQNSALAHELAELAQAVADQLFLPFPSFSRSAEAHAYAAAAGDVARALESNLGLMRSDWIRARALAADQESLAARRLFDHVRSGFIASGRHFEAILTTLELIGLLLADSSNDPAALPLARELLAFGQAMPLHGEALAAIRDFHEAVAHERASAKLARALVSYLYRARHDQALRFEGPP